MAKEIAEEVVDTAIKDFNSQKESYFSDDKFKASIDSLGSNMENLSANWTTNSGLSASANIEKMKEEIENACRDLTICYNRVSTIELSYKVVLIDRHYETINPTGGNQ